MRLLGGWPIVATAAAAQDRRERHDRATELWPKADAPSREPGTVFVSVLRAQVHVGLRRVDLSDTQLQLLLFLAAARGNVARGEIVSTLWNEVDDAAGNNAFNICLHRLRKAIGQDVIERGTAGYRLDQLVDVDIRSIAKFVRHCHGREELADAERRRARNYLAALTCCERSRYQSWQWFDRVLREIGDLRYELGARLAGELLRSGQAQEALELARDLIDEDPYDEPAHDMSIRAHLALGDEAAALREYRHYRDLIRSELQAEPSHAIARLFGD